MSGGGGGLIELVAVGSRDGPDFYNGNPTSSSSQDPFLKSVLLHLVSSHYDPLVPASIWLAIFSSGFR